MTDVTLSLSHTPHTHTHTYIFLFIKSGLHNTDIHFLSRQCYITRQASILLLNLLQYSI